ncbi:YndJ family protein [Haliangium ochraceum]|nr:YndJ family protein [Haliangium ochraceum]
MCPADSHPGNRRANAARDAALGVTWLAAALGALAWCTAFLGPWAPASAPWIARLSALGALVSAPLCLQLAGAGAARDTPLAGARWFRVAAYTQPIGAAFALWATVLEPGPLAGVLAGAWLLAACAPAGFAASRALLRGPDPLEELCIDLGLVYLPVGALWLVVSCGGGTLLGFSEPWVGLAAAHFHIAGAAATVLAGAIGRALRAGDPALSRRYWAIYALGARALLAGVPMVALGIALAPVLELAGALVTVLALLLLAAAASAGVLPTLRGPWLRALLALALLCVPLSAALASVYALGGFLGRAWLPLWLMVAAHGVPLALALGALAPLALALLAPPRRWRDAALPPSRLRACWYPAPGGRDGHAARSLGLVDALAAFRRPDFDPARVHPAVRALLERPPQLRGCAPTRYAPGWDRVAHLLQRVAAALATPGSAPGLRSPRDTTGMQVCAVPRRRDGRERVRALARFHPSGDALAYLLACAAQRCQGESYLDLVRPLRSGNVRSILRVETWNSDDRPNLDHSLVLRTRPAREVPQPAGMYLLLGPLHLRLPLAETIYIAAAGTASAAALSGDLAAPETRTATPPGARVLVRRELRVGAWPLLTQVSWWSADAE